MDASNVLTFVVVNVIFKVIEPNIYAQNHGIGLTERLWLIYFGSSFIREIGLVIPSWREIEFKILSNNEKCRKYGIQKSETF